MLVMTRLIIVSDEVSYNDHSHGSNIITDVQYNDGEANSNNVG